MREILFKGQKKGSKEWIKGYYAVIGTRHVIIKAQSEDYYSVDDSLKKSHGNEIVEVDPETVCQYTGLTGKNGRKIFEGDIIRKLVNIYKLGQSTPDGERILVGVVIWDDSSFTYPGNWSIKARDEYRNETTYTFDNKYEVIGNIFDDPELLKGDKF